MDNRAVALRVLARHQGQVVAGGGRWDGKLTGPTFRLQWSDQIWQLEELPQKGKKKLRQAEMTNPMGMYGSHRGFDALIPANILRKAHVSSSDTYDHVRDKIAKFMEEAIKETIATKAKEGDTGNRSWDFLTHMGKWQEKEVYFTQVMPEGMEAYKVEGKDFVLNVEWTGFKAYSPNSDFQQADPHYSVYNESSPGAARKLYQMLREDPKAIAHISWSDFSDWLNKNKIGYKTHFSQWG